MRAESTPAHLARADADGGAVLDVDDGVGLDVLGHLPGELQVGQLGLRSAASVTTLSSTSSMPAVVAALHQHAAGERA